MSDLLTAAAGRATKKLLGLTASARTTGRPRTTRLTADAGRASVQAATRVVAVASGATRRMAQRSGPLAARLATAGPTLAPASAPRLVPDAEASRASEAAHLAIMAVRPTLPTVATIATEPGPGPVPDAPGLRETGPTRTYGKVELVTRLAAPTLVLPRARPLVGPITTQLL